MDSCFRPRVLVERPVLLTVPSSLSTGTSTPPHSPPHPTNTAHLSIKCTSLAWMAARPGSGLVFKPRAPPTRLSEAAYLSLHAVVWWTLSLVWMEEERPPPHPLQDQNGKIHMNSYHFTSRLFHFFFFSKRIFWAARFFCLHFFFFFF